MTSARLFMWSAALGGAMTVAAAAQTPVRPQAPNMPPTDQVVPEKIAPKEPSDTGAVGSGSTLSEKLEASDGVIKPRDVDPEITAPAPVPNPGTTPVIPPPGSPGGNQSIVPK